MGGGDVAGALVLQARAYTVQHQHIDRRLGLRACGTVRKIKRPQRMLA
jgi:hypothetical protein